MGAHGGTFTRRVSCRCYCGYRRCCCCCSYGARQCARTRTTVGRHGVTTRSQHRVVLSCPEVGRWPLGCSFSLTLGFFLQHVLSRSPLFSLTFLFSFSFFLSLFLSFSYSLALSRAKRDVGDGGSFSLPPPDRPLSSRNDVYVLSVAPSALSPGLSLSRRVHEKFECAEIVSSGRARTRDSRLARGARYDLAAQFTAHSTETPQGHSTTTRHGKR